MDIYVVDDDRIMNELISFTLQSNGFKTKSFFKYSDALNCIDTPPKLWLLDIMLDDNLNGLDLMKIIKERTPQVSVCFLSARDSELDRITGLEIGSEDYITKPFSKQELVLRIKNIMKRASNPQNIIAREIIEFKEYKVNEKRKEIKKGTQEIKLTSKEFELFLYLLKNSNRTIDRNTLLRIIWDSNYFGSGRVLDDTIRRIRKKINEVQIETVYGEGYKLILDEDINF